jgi:TrmH family RNA methyltransferase
LRLIADTETPQGVIAVLDLPDTPLPSLHPATALVLVLDSVRDPGNVGTLIRTAAAAGCTAVITTFGTADAYAPKVVRAAMGSHFRLPVVYDVAWEWLGPALAALPATYATDGDATLPYDTVDWTRGAAIIVGNEDHGVSPDALPWVAGNVVIPMARGVESLNAAMSGAIVLFEAARQRRAKS